MACGSVSQEGFLLMQDKIDTQKGENRILRQKLQSKAEALLILSKELEKVRAECDDYRDLTQTLQSKYSSLKSGNRGIVPNDEDASSGDNSFNSRSFRDNSVAKHFAELRGENKNLLNERERLRRMLKDREEDVKLVRGQLYAEKKGLEITRKDVGCERGEDMDLLVTRLEALQLKYANLKQDLQSLLDEKEDLVQERDSYKCKVHRLNHAMSALLKNDGFKSIDVDWLLAENRFLQESLGQVKDEKQLANEMGRRYKSALDKSKFNVGKKEGEDASCAKIMELIRQTAFPCQPNVDLKDARSLQELCMTLLETLSDRMLQLKHQRKANKHILDKLRLLEEKVLGMDNGELILRPSQCLMQGYSNASVDQQNGDDALEEKLDEVFSRTSSTSQEPNFDSAADVSKDEDVKETLNPPDIIVQGIPRAREPCVWIEEEEEEKTVPNKNSSEGLDETIVLPDHLQLLVDQAMKSLEEQ